MSLGNRFTPYLFVLFMVHFVIRSGLTDSHSSPGNNRDEDSKKTEKKGKHLDEAKREQKVLADMFHPELHKEGKDWKFKNLSEIADSPPDPDDEFEQTRPLPRSRTLIWAYLKMHEVVPHIVPLAAKDAIEVTYEKDVIVDFGFELTEDQVGDQPINMTWPVERGAHYTLILFTPDSPSRFNQTEGQFVFWFVADINESCEAKSGNTYTEYLGPKAWTMKPEQFGELRRYIYIVYKQPENNQGITYKEHYDSRQGFNVTEFANEYKLGRPVAMNFFQMSAVKQKRN